MDNHKRIAFIAFALITFRESRRIVPTAQVQVHMMSLKYFYNITRSTTLNTKCGAIRVVNICARCVEKVFISLPRMMIITQMDEFVYFFVNSRV